MFRYRLKCQSYHKECNAFMNMTHSDFIFYFPKWSTSKLGTYGYGLSPRDLDAPVINLSTVVFRRSSSFWMKFYFNSRCVLNWLCSLVVSKSVMHRWTTITIFPRLSLNYVNHSFAFTQRSLVLESVMNVVYCFIALQNAWIELPFFNLQSNILSKIYIVNNYTFIQSCVW